MYLNSTMQRGLVIGGVALLATVVLIGVTRREAAPEPLPAAMNLANSGNPEPVSRNVDTPVINAVSPFGSENVGATPIPAAAVYPVATERYQVVQPVAAERYVAPRRPAVRRYTSSRRYVASRNRRPRVVVHRRKFSHSAAIVGGSAAGGAAIGALAGGGKGAGIGALAGGAGGLVYDRLTHKKKVVVR